MDAADEAMNTSFAGGCLCDAVRFRCREAPIAMYNCHCKGCQAIHGAPFAPLLAVNAAGTVITGALERDRRWLGQDGHPRRSGCPSCRAMLFAGSDALPHVLLINAMFLDDPGMFEPVADIWTVDAQPWTCMDRHIPKVYKSTPLIDLDIA